MIVRLADEQDAPGLVELARQVEEWFGPMAGDQGSAGAPPCSPSTAARLACWAACCSAPGPAYHVRWLVVSGPARRQGAGRALMAEAMRRFGTAPAWWK
jgi:ribosomal protein S18 acetylase RimI-like enzyme